MVKVVGQANAVGRTSIEGSFLKLLLLYLLAAHTNVLARKEHTSSARLSGWVISCRFESLFMVAVWVCSENHVCMWTYWLDCNSVCHWWWYKMLSCWWQPIRQLTFSCEYVISDKTNSQFWIYEAHPSVLCTAQQDALEPEVSWRRRRVVKFTSFSTTLWTCLLYTSDAADE